MAPVQIYCCSHLSMYSYDRRKTARRGIGDFVDDLHAAAEAAQKAAKIAEAYVRETDALSHFLQISLDSNGKDFLRTVGLLAKELPVIIAAVDRIDDAMDGYARAVRRGLPRQREPLEASDLDPQVVKTLKAQATPLASKIRTLAMMADDAPAEFELEDYLDSPRIAAINKLGEQMGELSSDIQFDPAWVVDFLNEIEDRLVEYVNRGAE